MQREDWLSEGRSKVRLLECLMVHFSRVWCGCSVVLFSCFPEYPDDVLHVFHTFVLRVFKCDIKNNLLEKAEVKWKQV